MKTKKERQEKIAENRKPLFNRWTFKPGDLSRRTLAQHRMAISILALSILAGLALTSGAGSVYEVIRANEPNLLKWQLWIPAFVFFVTLFRFLLGNIIHIRMLEDEAVGPYIWLFDLSVIALELLLFNIIGNFLIPKDISMFVTLLLILLGIDIFWVIVIAIGYAKGKGQGSRKSVPWQWCILNVVTVVLLVFQLKPTFCLNVTQVCGLIFFGALMFIMAVIDIVLVDVYGLLKK